MRHFTPEKLHAYLSEKNAEPLLLDVREQWEFDYCHIEGSVLIPMGQVPGKLDTLDPDREIIVICHHGIRSRQIGYYMEQAGFKNIVNLDGGVEQWANDIDSTMPRY